MEPVFALDSIGASGHPEVLAMRLYWTNGVKREGEDAILVPRVVGEALQKMLAKPHVFRE